MKMFPPYAFSTIFIKSSSHFQSNFCSVSTQAECKAHLQKKVNSPEMKRNIGNSAACSVMSASYLIKSTITGTESCSSKVDARHREPLVSEGKKMHKTCLSATGKTEKPRILVSLHTIHLKAITHQSKA